MSAANLSIVDEVETALNTGSAEKRLEAVRRVTELSSWVAAAGSEVLIRILNVGIFFRSFRRKRESRNWGADSIRA